jgi:hypothetical protein
MKKVPENIDLNSCGSKVSDRSVKNNLNIFHTNVTNNLTVKECKVFDTNPRINKLFNTDNINSLSLSDSKELAKFVIEQVSGLNITKNAKLTLGIKD